MKILAYMRYFENSKFHATGRSLTPESLAQAACKVTLSTLLTCPRTFNHSLIYVNPIGSHTINQNTLLTINDVRY